MIEPTIGFIVYGVHKDGLRDPMGQPFIDDAVIAKSADALIKAGLKLIRHDVVLSTKEEAIAALRRMKNDPQIDAIVLFSTEQAMDWFLEVFALEVPESHVDGAHGSDGDGTAAEILRPAQHFLPEAFGFERLFAE